MTQSDYSGDDSDEIMSESDNYSQDAQVFPIEDFSGDELEKQLEDFKKFNSRKLARNEDEVEEEEENDQVGWGRSRRDYYGQSESEEDEGEEGIKIQKAQLSKMREEDYYGEFTAEESKKVEKKLKKLETFDTEKFNNHLSEAIEILQNGDYDPDYVTLKFLYLTNLSFYYSLLNGPEHETRMSHPVVQRLEELEAILDQVNRAGVSPVKGQSNGDTFNQFNDEDAMASNEEIDSMISDLEDAEDIIKDSAEESDQHLSQSEMEQSEEEEEYEPIFEKRSKKKLDKFGEIEKLNEIDLLEKNNRRKALNFRVSQVEQSLMQKSHQRGGDDDLPFKVKAKKDFSRDEEEMSVSDNENASNSEQGSENDQSAEVDIFGEDEYYQKIKNEKLTKKKEREERYAQINEPLIDTYVEPEMDGDEKRKATWRILANRGLTPFRKKENRNPRVKKRMKYEKAVKKLPSTRRVAVDKKKLSKYGGEMTGIKSNLARSTKF